MKLRMLLHTTKYDGGLHYRFPVELVHEDANLLVTYRGPHVMMESYRGSFASKYHLLHWNDRHWNLDLHWHEDWTPGNHYVNIATPASWKDDVVTCCDLDLDLSMRAGGRDVRVEDEDEFEEHRIKWSYPPELVDLCRRMVVEVSELMRSSPLFDGRLHEWRPGRALPALDL